MKSPWRFFFVVEGILLLGALWQLSHNWPLVILLFLGISSIYLGNKKKNGNHSFLTIVGGLMICVSLLNNIAVWLMALFAILFIGLKGAELSGLSFMNTSLWNKKGIWIVETEEPQDHSGQKSRQKWIGNERIGSHIYEWDDINLTVLTGDTIIDLGNTILPKTDNIIIIRKGFGRTRILIPNGIGVQLEHSAIAGKVYLDEEAILLKNERLTIFSKDYEESSRHIKIVSNVFIGDFEVIRV